MKFGSDFVEFYSVAFRIRPENDESESESESENGNGNEGLWFWEPFPAHQVAQPSHLAVVKLHRHLLGIRDKVRRDVTAVKLHVRQQQAQFRNEVTGGGKTCILRF